MKIFLIILLAIEFIPCAESRTEVLFKKLSKSRLAALYAKHYDSYKKFLQKYKQGVNDERPEPLRLLTYANSIKQIKQHNKLYKEGKSTFKLGLNSMADVTLEEFQRNHPVKEQQANIRWNFTSTVGEFPRTVNWVTMGYVTDALRLENCYCGGAAVAITGQLEALIRKTGEFQGLFQLSAQELLDCVGNGCNGFTQPEEYINYIIRNKGLQSGFSYPWIGRQAACTANRYQARYGGILNYYTIKPYDTQMLKAAISIQPVVVQIYAVTEKFRNYRGGIYEERVPALLTSHSMLAVGYGENYFLLKNSWGREWGENGFMRITTDMARNCNLGAYPVQMF